MTLPLFQENRQSFRHPPPRPPPPATANPSKSPKNCVPIQSTNSTSSSSSAFDQFSKRVTRDLPNLSDCHGCRVHINHTDPDDRLQTLDSFWRIVLLCKKCIRCVNSGQTCAYCFKNTDDSGCSKCRSCKRHVHKDCVNRYGNSAPWSFSSSEEGIQKDVLKIQICSSDLISSEKIAKHANLEGKRKEVVVGLKAKDSTLRKAVVAKNAMGLAKSALESVAKKGKNKGKVASKDVNDAEFAFQLHRSMNSSPRISKTLGPKNSSYVGGPEIQTLPNSTGDRLKVYSRTKLKEKVGQTSSETSPRVTVYSRRRLKEEVGKASSDASPCLLVYSRTRFKEKVCQTDSEAPPCVTTNERGSCVDSACSKAELLTYKRNRLKRKICKEKVGFTEDRYLLKYSRRKRCSEPGSDVHGDTFPQPTPDRSMPTNCCHSI
ncbi:hypothetical protein H5410_010711 [Solanum commersonii]|uniref:Uncharacterized protein n=1 Tax=Solanum commersonii TaxID=4109 RepID=A0A9J6ALH2_SOLCO|nr:hypothetical protein H5410_010711 [Solanum commersonii]